LILPPLKARGSTYFTGIEERHQPDLASPFLQQLEDNNSRDSSKISKVAQLL
jgi:hypothetical protein